MGKMFLMASVLALGAGGAVQAGTFDVSKVTCGELTALPEDQMNKLLFWMDGYMGGAAEDVTYDDERLQQNMDAALSACGGTPDATVMELLDKAENG
ncbi:HdeA/HdeB family chaperone [Paragemmobacter aquarius]|nr:HdeA/HdeB family chaperone [Gemmobacter aquarius]